MFESENLVEIECQQLEECVLPLTQAQLGIWLGHQRAPDPSIYNAAQLFHFGPGIERSVFQSALVETLAEAEAMHLEFFETGGRPRCRVLSKPWEERTQWCRRVVSVSRLHESELGSHCRKVMRTPFALDGEPLFRHELFELENGRFAWLHCCHHIALDGYGFHLIAQRVAERYTAHLHGTSPRSSWFTPLGPVVEEDVRYQTGPRKAQDAAFFAALLEGQTGPAIVHDRVPALALKRTASLSHSAERRLVETLSPMHFLSGLLLGATRTCARFVGQSSMTVGLPAMMRFGSQALKTPCMAMNIVALPLDACWDRSWPEASAFLSEAVRKTRPHQRYRYEDLKSLVDKDHLFSPVINVLPFEGTAEFGGQLPRVEEISSGPVQDLSFSFTRGTQGWTLGVDVHPDLFTRAEADTLLRDLIETFERVDGTTRSSGARSARHERDPNLEPSITPERYFVPHALLAHRETRPQAIALETPSGQRTTYSELFLVVQELASRIAASTDPGDLVALDVGRGVESVVAPLAVMTAGCGYVALDAKHPPARKEAILKQAGPRLILSSRTAAHGPKRKESLSQPDPEFYLTPFEAPALPAQVERRELSAVDYAPERTAYVVFTSGSTGTPKGVVVPTRALCHFIGAAIERYQVSAQDRVLQFASLSFDASVEEIFVTLVAGGTVLVRQDETPQSPEELLESAARNRVSILDLPTAYFHEVSRASASFRIQKWRELRLVIVGGEALRMESVRAFTRWAPDVSLVNSYGPSEATVVATTHVVEASSCLATTVPLGRPLAGVAVRIVDEHQEPVERPWAYGEICLSGPTLADGYHHDATQTQERFFEIPGRGRWYRTGDRGCWDFSGHLIFGGRVDDELKVSGHRVVPKEIEATLCLHPEIAAAVVLGHDDPDWGIVLWAVVEMEAVDPDWGPIRAFLMEHLPAALIPSAILPMRRIPRTVSGKLDRAACRAEVVAQASLVRTERLREKSSRSAQETDLAPSDLQDLILSAWTEVLGVRKVGPEDDFFELGGSSLQVIQLASLLFDQGVTLSVARIFRHPTPRSQCEAVAGAKLEVADEVWRPPHVSLSVPKVIEVDRAPPTTVVLTGATGFVGIFVLEELLEHTPAEVVCLVRASSQEEAQFRVHQQASRHGIDLGPWLTRLKFWPLGGGAAAGDWERCHLKAGAAVVHCAASVSLTRDYQSLVLDNVSWTRDLLEAAARCGAQFHYLSTLATVPNHALERDTAESFFESHAGLADGYQRSKAHGEWLCRQAKEQGLPVAVHRLGRVVGPRRAPAINPNDIVWRMAQAALTLGACPRLEIVEPWSPADDVAKNLVGLIRAGAAWDDGGVFHVVQDEPFQVDRLFERVEQLGDGLERVPLSEFIARLKRSEQSEHQVMSAFFELRERNAPVAARQYFARAMRARLGEAVAADPVSDTLLEAYVRSAVETGYFGSAPNRKGGLR